MMAPLGGRTRVVAPLVAVALAGLVFLGWILAGVPRFAVQVTAQESGQTIRLPLGAYLGVQLQGFRVSSTAGQSADRWGPPRSSDESVLEPVPDRRIAIDLPWTEPVTRATFRGRSPGTAQVNALVCNPRAAGCGRFSVTVVVG